MSRIEEKRRNLRHWIHSRKGPKIPILEPKTDIKLALNDIATSVEKPGIYVKKKDTRYNDRASF